MFFSQQINRWDMLVHVTRVNTGKLYREDGHLVHRCDEAIVKKESNIMVGLVHPNIVNIITCEGRFLII